MEETLFPLPEKEETEEEPSRTGKPRMNRANREQIEWRAMAIDQMLPEDHRARLVWEWVEGLETRPVEAKIAAVEGVPGRNVIDPKILIALWLYATIEGVGSARQLGRLCEEHLAYLWLCGGVRVNYHTLADFRVEHGGYLEELMIKSIAALMTEGLVKLDRVAQDGKKVRASAGSGSFHRGSTLDRHLEAAQRQVERLRQELETDPQQGNRRQKAARERAARERQERVEAAKKQMEKMEQRAKQTGRDVADRKAGKERRASETDPEARVMKMANGGFSPAHNVQFCTDTQTDLIVGIQVSQQGNDTGLASIMLAEVQANHGKTPAELLADSSYFSGDEIVKLSQQGCQAYMAIPNKSSSPENRYQPKKQDAPEVATFRMRMGTPEAQEILKQRGAIAELVHAVLDQWNLDRVRVRGSEKVKTVMLWFVLAHNWLRTLLLRKRLVQVAAI